MKRSFAILLSMVLIALPSVAKDKAPKEEKVKNVILIIGDGMGLGATASWMASRNFESTCFDRAQYSAVVKTYSANSRTTDSAAAATAIATGNKTNNSMLGMLPDGSKVTSIAELAKDKGLSTGIVVTSYVQDATPAAFYAHVADRGDKRGINEDLLTFRPDVIVGGGRKYFVHKKYADENLIDKAVSEGFAYVETPEKFYSTWTTPVLGLLDEGSQLEEAEVNSDLLSDLAGHTYELLEKNKKGFFAMIEGSNIDHAAHANNSEMVLWWMDEFDKLVNAAFDYADTHKGTLVIVTADHETGGISIVPGSNDFTKGESGLEMRYSVNSHTAAPVLLYAYGPSSWRFSGVIDNTDVFKKIKSMLIDR